MVAQLRRRGQQNAVYRSARDGRHLLAQAPTGIGKTLGTLFPALKALALRKLDKVFFLTAKTSGRQLAIASLRALFAESKAPVRVLELVARESLCEHPDKTCDGDSCPLAKGFYDRLADARQAAVAHPFLDRARVAQVAREHGICSYYLVQELVRWADVIVGDYNHYFDGTALLYDATVTNEWQVIVLVDEAHNLIDRARSMYSAELREGALHAAARSAPGALKRVLKRLGRQWKELVAEQAEEYRVHGAMPKKFLDALERAVVAIAELQAEGLEPIGPELLEFFFEATRFVRLAENFGAHSLFDSSVTQPNLANRAAFNSTLCLRNVVPAPHLKARFAAARSVSLFSATLAPTGFYRDMFGLPADTTGIDVESPFAPEQLDVRVTRISTRYADRARSLAPVARLIAAQFAEAPGNYIAFFSSFEYLGQVAGELKLCCPSVPVWLQTARMDDLSQAAFLDRFEEKGQGVGFAVLGGRFAEGVDLPGRRLIGAFIATLGMPPVTPVNEQMRRVMASQFGAGHEYTYLYPGLRKVVQAAGRVIRTSSDRGVVHLIDDRFEKSRIQALLPRWWRG